MTLLKNRWIIALMILTAFIMNVFPVSAGEGPVSGSDPEEAGIVSEKEETVLGEEMPGEENCVEVRDREEPEEPAEEWEEADGITVEEGMDEGAPSDAENGNSLENLSIPPFSAKPNQIFYILEKQTFNSLGTANFEKALSSFNGEGYICLYYDFDLRDTAGSIRLSLDLYDASNVKKVDGIFSNQYSGGFIDRFYSYKIGVSTGEHVNCRIFASDEAADVPMTIKVEFYKETGWESEPNNQVADMEKPVLGEEYLYHGTLASNKDVDMYLIDLSKGQTPLLIDYNNQRINTNQKWKLTLRSLDAWSTVFSGVMEDSGSVQTKNLPAGQYVLSVEQPNAGQYYWGEYTFSLIPAGWPETLTIIPPGNVFIGDTFRLDVEVHPAGAGDAELVFTSSKSSVLLVEDAAAGKLRAVGSGSCTITVTAKSDPSVSNSCTISVSKRTNLVQGVVSADRSLTLQVGQTALLTTAVNTTIPDSAEQPSFAYASSAPAVAGVNNGVVSALSEGSAVISITARTGDDRTGKTTGVEVRVLPSQAEEEDLNAVEKALSEGKLLVLGISDQDYTGKALTQPLLRVYDGHKKLKQGTDYTLSYKNNVNVSEDGASVYIRFKGNYSGERRESFGIRQQTLSEENGFSISVQDSAFKLGMKMPVPKVLYKGKALSPKSYDVVYTDAGSGRSGPSLAALSEGEISVTVIGKGNYTGSLSSSFVLNNSMLSISKAAVSRIRPMEYSPQGACPVEGVDYMLTYKQGKTAIRLIPGQDYTVSYENNTLPGKAVMVLKGSRVTNPSTGLAFMGEKRVTYKISGYPISRARMISSDREDSGVFLTSVPFTGSEILQDPVLYYVINGSETVLQKGTDYSVTCENNINAGKATMTITGLGRFTGSLKKKFKITPRRLTDDLLVMDENCRYMKGGAVPEITLVYSYGRQSYVLQEDVDYKVSFKGNTAPGSALAVIKGKGNFSGTLTKAFTVEEGSLEDCRIIAPDTKLGKKTWQSRPLVMDSRGASLKLNKDYILEYSVDEEPEEGQIVTVYVQGRGYYAGSVTAASYRVKSMPQSIRGAKVTYVGDRISYRGGAPVTIDASELLVTLKKVRLNGSPGDNVCADYEIIDFTANSAKGKAKVTIRGKGNYTGTKTVTFTIEPRNGEE